jgi:cobalamin biosynthesis Mg chelatase CobN
MKRDALARRRQGERVRPAPTGVASSEVYAGLERLKRLEEQYARAAMNSREHRRLAAAIRIEAVAYRKSLDTGQASARHDARTSTAGKPTPVR